MSLFNKQCGEVFATFNDITICISNAHVEYDSTTKEVSVVKNDTDILSVTQDFINIKTTSYSESGDTLTCKTKGGSVTLDLQMFEEQPEEEEKEEKDEKGEKDDKEEKDADKKDDADEKEEKKEDDDEILADESDEKE